jgi:hypothetical protein
MNTCNGATIFEKNNSEIKSEENKLIVFDGKLRHKAKSQIDTDRRIVINFNWRNKLAAKGVDGTDVKSTSTTQNDSFFRDGSGLLKLPIVHLPKPK